jgi:isopentenyl diphosphate isomerase/L-lactate dehydrogenase-like FMN-dependent dehydrogenase
MIEAPLEQMALKDIQEMAHRRMSEEALRHFLGAAESRSSYRRNQRAFGRWLFRQRIFHDVTDPDTSIELFGRKLKTPACVAPIGSFELIGDDANREVAQGAGRAGTMVFASHAAKATMEDWATSSGPVVFMAYLNRGREDTLRCMRAAERLGFAAVGATMDTIQPVKIGDHVALSKDGKPRKGFPSTPKNIEWIKSETSLPVVIKGIMNPEDARVAVNAGADALIVSNHGGRILDCGRAAIEVLPEVVEAVGGKVPVLFDSGIRRGGDIAKALALGAKAALVGRPVGWGVAAAGAAGVERVIEILTEELKRVLILTGVGAVTQVNQAILIRD